MPDIVTIAIALVFGVAGGNAAGDYLLQEDYGLGLGNTIAGGIGGVVGSLVLQFVFPALSGFDDWRAIVGQVIAAFVSGALLAVIVGVVQAGRPRR